MFFNEIQIHLVCRKLLQRLQNILFAIFRFEHARLVFHSSNGTEVGYTKCTSNENQPKIILLVGGQILTIEGSKIVKSKILDIILILPKQR